MGTTQPPSSSSKPPWRVLEFYSGIGGMRYSLIHAMGAGGKGDGSAPFQVLEAFEINEKANDVYQFNFSHRPYQGNIQNLDLVQLDKYGADAWLLSPPCQPYTRQGLQKDSADARASSFIKILELIPSMKKPPFFMFVENVVGFETSDTHRQLMDILSANDFITQEFILSPLQFGIPYSRPRYFCLAKRKPLLFKAPLFNRQLLHAPIPLFFSGNEEAYDGTSHACVRWDESDFFCSPIKNFLQSSCSSTYHIEDAECNLFKNPTNYNEELHKDQQDGYPVNVYASGLATDDCAAADDNLVSAEGKNSIMDPMGEFVVPLNLVERWGNAMDVVFPDSKRCCCFTKSYYRYVKGTGSLLATVQLTAESENSSLKNLGLRYFTPLEVANLHSFPQDFAFPPHITLRQRYALLGNSLSIAVVAPLLRYLFAEPT